MKKVMMTTLLVGSLSLSACATTGYNDPYYGNRNNGNAALKARHGCRISIPLQAREADRLIAGDDLVVPAVHDRDRTLRRLGRVQGRDVVRGRGRRQHDEGRVAA